MNTLHSSLMALLVGIMCLFSTSTLRADILPPKLGPIEDAGNGTYQITCSGRDKFHRGTDDLKTLATEEATRYCTAQNKQLKIISTKESKGMYLVGGFPSITLVFKALSMTDPESVSATATTGDFYSTLIKLDDLRKRGIITEEEFLAEKKKVLGEIK